MHPRVLGGGASTVIANAAVIPNTPVIPNLFRNLKETAEIVSINPLYPPILGDYL